MTRLLSNGGVYRTAPATLGLLRYEDRQEKSRIRETPTLSTNADSRTDTILEKLRDLPIRTEKRTWSTRK